MAELMQLDGENFAAAVAKGVTLVDFWASWCGPCRMMLPVLEKAAAELEGTAKTAKVNVEEQKELAIRYQVRTLPTFLIFRDGEVRFTLTGPQSLEKLLAKVREALQN